MVTEESLEALDRLLWLRREKLPRISVVSAWAATGNG